MAIGVPKNGRYRIKDESGNFVQIYVETHADQVMGLGRRNNETYKVQDIAYTKSRQDVALQCVTGGTTGNVDLDLTNVSINDTITDGSVTWKVIKRTYVDELDANTAILSMMIGTVQNKNGIYRGKHLGTLTSVSDTDKFVADHKIATNEFDDIFIGDEITIQTAKYPATWLVFGINPHFNKGDTALTAYHIGLIPKTPLFNAVMNDTDTTTGGYAGSKMHTETIPDVVADLQAVLGSHLLLHRKLLSTSVDTNTHSSGAPWASGASKSWEWRDVYACLPSEVEVYGAPIWSSSGYDTGEAHPKLPLFNFINPVFHSRWSFWLRGVGYGTTFCHCYHYGSAHAWYASNSLGVRPLILLG